MPHFKAKNAPDWISGVYPFVLLSVCVLDRVFDTHTHTHTHRRRCGNAQSTDEATSWRRCIVDAIVLHQRYAMCLMPDFQRSVSVAVAVSVKIVSIQAVYAVASGACARQ